MGNVMMGGVSFTDEKKKKKDGKENGITTKGN